MSEVKITKQIPSTVKEVVSHLICDFCGAKSQDEKNWAVNVNKPIQEITIQYAELTRVPDALDIYEIFHLCPKCWNEKLVPWMRQNDAISTIKEY